MTAGYFPPCLRQTSSTYTRYAVVGLPSAGQKISPPWRDIFHPACVRPPRRTPGTPSSVCHRRDKKSRRRGGIHFRPACVRPPRRTPGTPSSVCHRRDKKSHRRGGIFSTLPASDLLDVHPVRRRRSAIGGTKNLAAVAGYISALPASDLLDVHPVRRRRSAIGGTKNLTAVAGYFPPCLRQTSSTYTRYAVVGLPSAGQKISPPWRDTFPPCLRQTSSAYARYAVVGLPSAGQKISPPWRDLFRPTIVRPGTPPINVRRGRRPAVERSGTNALGVRRPVVGADEAARPPSPYLYTNNKERTICTRSFCASWARWS